MSAVALTRTAPPPECIDEAARAYDLAGEAYLNYADGDPHRIYDFDGRYAYGDRRIWAVIERTLVALAESGQKTLTVLDAGCGPGTWMRRILLRAHLLGFTRVVARGFDISPEQIVLAQKVAGRAAALPGAACEFELGDITQPLPEQSGSVDLCLCLYGVLNHLPVERHAGVAAELARVTGGHLIVTTRAIGSTPTIYVDGVESAEWFRQDNAIDRLEVDLRDGRHFEFSSHLFAAAELDQLFAPHLDSMLVGLDLFHGRFAPDPRWNPDRVGEDVDFYRDLDRLERQYGGDPHFIDHATHLMLIGRPRQICEK
ncbi:Methyltransferase domain-containing protein [Sphingomonas laterariae]|uniref:Methyltransferase domain-containing protein n=1 Tax=Edaphosphingomonas laterariae TaxID=861865 RepID=A0A239BXG3_9SPHN|nr:class I SAM-dependent methyltransferase [Sphingomonas laterariae]SNS12342.1 Methyltransferase domain-containing protein [Sphingomonas laterariae]